MIGELIVYDGRNDMAHDGHSHWSWLAVVGSDQEGLMMANDLL